MNRSIEDELRTLLRRKEPSEGFAERVVARLARKSTGRIASRSRPRRLWRRPLLAWAVAATLACVLAFAFREHHRQQEGEMARAQTILALRIASSQLNGTLKEVVQMNPPAAPERPGARSLGEREPL